MIGAFLGLAIGDAVGMVNEFAPRDKYVVRGMRAGGPFNLKAGYWTDDTSMAICLAESILAKDTIDPKDVMRRFYRWFKHGVNSSTGVCFDIGNNTRKVLTTRKVKPTYNGNGSIMRLAPVCLRWQGEEARAMALKQSNVTHGVMAGMCAIELATILDDASRGTLATSVPRVGIPSVLNRRRDQISSSGYCVDTLEAALWCVNATGSFKAAVLTAANLGDDADTVAAVTGQIAGALYTIDKMPQDWLLKIQQSERLIRIAEELYSRRTS